MAEENKKKETASQTAPKKDASTGGAVHGSSAPVLHMEDFTDCYEESDIQENKIVALLSYLFFLFLVPILSCPNSGFARFHANQGLVLFLAELAGAVVFGLVNRLFSFLSLGWLAAVLSWAFYALILVLAVVGIVNAAQGKAQELPIIGRVRIIH